MFSYFVGKLLYCQRIKKRIFENLLANSAHSLGNERPCASVLLIEVEGIRYVCTYTLQPRQITAGKAKCRLHNMLPNVAYHLLPLLSKGKGDGMEPVIIYRDSTYSTLGVTRRRQVANLSEAVFTDAKSRIINPRLYQKRQFCPDFLLVWIL